MRGGPRISYVYKLEITVEPKNVMGFTTSDLKDRVSGFLSLSKKHGKGDGLCAYICLAQHQLGFKRRLEESAMERRHRTTIDDVSRRVQGENKIP